MHALSNVIGAPQYLANDLAKAAEAVLAEVQNGSVDDHVRPGGWYGHFVAYKSSPYTAGVLTIFYK